MSLMTDVNDLAASYYTIKTSWYKSAHKAYVVKLYIALFLQMVLWLHDIIHM